MIDKERLEEYEKQILKGVKRLLNSPEMQCNHCGMIFKGDHECDYEYLKEQNKRYREALEFYASGKHYKLSTMFPFTQKVITDDGEKARKALEEYNNGSN